MLYCVALYVVSFDHVHNTCIIIHPNIHMYYMVYHLAGKYLAICRQKLFEFGDYYERVPFDESRT